MSPFATGWHGAARLVFVVALLAVVVEAASAGRAEEIGRAAQPPEIESLKLGFDGLFKVGHFVPARVRIQNTSRPQTVEVEVLVPDDRGVPCRFTTEEVILQSRESREIVTYVKVGRPRGTVLVKCFSTTREFFFGSAAENSAGRSIASTDELVLTLGASIGVGDALALGASETSWRAHSVEIASVEDLPTDPRGFDCVDTLVLATSDAPFYEALAAARPQRAAIEQWLRFGGRMLVCGGWRAPEILASDRPQVILLPVDLAEMVPLRNTSAVEAYANTNSPIDVSPLTERLMIPRLEKVRGNVEAWAGNRIGELPLVVRAPFGLGEVTFVSLDLDRPPLSQWDARPRMINRLLNRQTQRLADSGRSTQGAVKTIGYNEMSGQLRAALDRFDNVAFVSFWVVAVLVGAYAIVIGPIDYWLVHRVLGKPNATWFTFALAALLFAGMGVAATSRLKGHEARLRQVELIDYDLTPRPELSDRSDRAASEPASEMAAVRTMAWLNFFAPEAAAYEFTNRQTLPGSGRGAKFSATGLSWNGLPGGGLGGMMTADTSQAAWTHAYETADHPARLVGLPMHEWSTQALVAQGHATAPAPLHFELRQQEDGLLAGVLANRLGVPLTNVSLFYDRWVYKIGPLAEKQELQLETLRDPLDARTLLTRQQIVGNADRAEVYDPEATDVARILEIQMFYDRVGGAAYTQLDNRYQQQIDLSHLLRDGRAILIAELGTRVSRLECQPAEIAPENYESTTFIRCILPVVANNQ